MTQLRRGILLLVIALFWAPSSSALAQDWVLVWSDEFDGDSLDTTKWSYQYGTGTSEGLVNWGNNELQYYTDRPENVFVADGKLHIVARQEPYQNRSYTSARIRSIHKGDWTYGRFEIRAKLPEGRGLWPAIWMMPTESVYGTWAASGEIDIMELVGHEPSVVHGTLHYGGTWPRNVESGASFRLPSGKFSDDFHTFTLLWREGEMRWFVDGIYYQNQLNWFSEGHDFPAPFDEKFHMLLNVAVGGRWPGNPDQTTVFPQTMEIDYVRVYQQRSGTSSEQFDEASSSALMTQNFPNPFTSMTTIDFSLPGPANVALHVYDVLGRRVAQLASGLHRAGTHRVQFDGADLPPGLYTYRLETESQNAVGKMLLVR